MIRAVLMVLLAWTGPAWAASLQTSQGTVDVTEMVGGLDTPWAIGVLPSGGFLVTERDGKLFYVENGRTKRVSGTPPVVAKGQGGLLDVTIARDFNRSREVFLTFSKRQKGDAGTALAVARLSENGDRLTNLRVIFEAIPGDQAAAISARAWLRLRMEACS